ncbi:MAG: type IV pilus assembly protein PilM, partial [Candidatus Omnitrophota bacterium]|nr:type IV pilus assembly protein PilM [Candidatus Omnitrophota bacterium]
LFQRERGAQAAVIKDRANMNFNIGKKFQSKIKNRVGLDIGSSFVKMVEIASSGENLSLVCLGMKKASSSIREPLIEAIRSLSGEINVTAKEAVISVSGPHVIVRFVAMPKMRDDELKGAIKFEAEKHIPFPINDCIVDHQILRKNDKEGKLEILLVAAKKDFIMNKVSIVEESGFSVNAVNVDTFAFANAFLKNPSRASAGKTAALLNIGSSFTNVGIVRDGVICFARDIVIGGDDFSQAISKALGIDVKAAEDLKLSPKDRLKDVTACTKNIMNNLLDDTRLSLSYYENQSGKSVDEICISGGSSSLPGLETLFQEAFESKPVLWDPFDSLDKSRGGFDTSLVEKMKGCFAVAVGLALR